MRPGTCGLMRTSPPTDSTRPGADAAHNDFGAAFGFAAAAVDDGSALAGSVDLAVKVCGT